MGIGNTANTGLKAAMTNMEVISNDIANTNTVGFKKSTAQFSEIFGMGKNVGLGVKTAYIKQDFSTGRIEMTDRALDLSLNNDGFFIQRSASSGVTSYTRAGRFDMDKEGYIINGGGARMQGYPAQNGQVLASGSLVDLKVPDAPVPAKASSLAKIAINLDAGAAIPSTTFDSQDPTSYNFRTDSTLFDSLGNPYSMSVFYVKTANNEWSANTFIDNQSIATGSLVFSDTGELTSTTGLDALSFTPTSGATSPQNIAISLTGSTQFAGEHRVQSSEQDGYAAGSPTGFNIDQDGRINVYYSNGRAQVAGQFAVARFKAPQDLAKADDTAWIATSQSGDPIVDPLLSDNVISSGTLEMSNVDLTEELVKLLSAQHDFQANAQVQETYNQLIKTIENL